MKYMIVLFMLLTVWLQLELRAGDPPATRPAEPQRVTLYAAIVRPGPMWRENQAAGRRNDMSKHLAYVTAMRAEGKLAFGGPFADGTGGLLVYHADSLDAATAFMNADPACVEKFFEFDMHPWLVNAADVPARN